MATYGIDYSASLLGFVCRSGVETFKHLSDSGNISRYDNQVYIEGDFSASFNKAVKLEANPPGYWLTGLNCAWLAIETLQESTSGITHDALNEIIWFEDYLFGDRRHAIIPNLSPGWIDKAFRDGGYEVHSTKLKK